MLRPYFGLSLMYSRGFGFRAGRVAVLSGKALFGLWKFQSSRF